MFKKMTAVTTALAISIMLAACGGDKDAARTEPPGARAAPARRPERKRTPEPRDREKSPRPPGRSDSTSAPRKNPQGPGTRPRPGPRPQEAPGESSGKPRKQGRPRPPPHRPPP